MYTILMPGEQLSVQFHESDGDIIVAFDQDAVRVKTDWSDSQGRGTKENPLLYEAFFGADDSTIDGWHDCVIELPPHKHEHPVSEHLWLALSDGRVVRGYAFYQLLAGESVWRGWNYYENSLGGSLVPRSLVPGDPLSVFYWKPMEWPQRPDRGWPVEAGR